MTFLGGISVPTSPGNYIDYSHIAGLATGIDTDSMVEALMRAERMPLDRLLQQKQLWQWKQEDYRTVNNALRELRDTMFSMKLQSPFLAKAATSSNPSAVTASAGTNASPATYTIDVTQLATPATAVSSSSISPASLNPDGLLSTELGLNSPFTFSINSKTFTIDPTKTTLNQVITQVNSSGANVVMGYDAYSRTVFVTSTATGGTTTLTLQDAPDSSFLGTTLKLPTSAPVTGQDASFKINGVSITSPSNEYNINGTKLLLAGAGSATVTVARNVDAVVESIKGFVDKFNSTMKTMTDLYHQKRNRDYPPLTDEQRAAMKDDQIKKWEEKARSGMLANDPTLDRAITSLRSLLSASLKPSDGSTPVYDTLSDIGITTGDWWTYGQLQVDETKLRQAVEANPDAVMQLFTTPHAVSTATDPNDPTAGIAVRMYDAVNSAMKLITNTAGASTDLVDNSFIGQRLREIDDRAYQMQRRLDDKRQQYYLQFTRLEEAINQMNSQSSYLASMLMGSGR